MSRSQYRLLLGLFAILWIALALSPTDRCGWLLENVWDTQKDMALASLSGTGLHGRHRNREQVDAARLYPGMD